MNEQIDLEDGAPWLLALITLAGAALRILLLSVKGMGLDETVNLWLAGHSLPEMLPWLARINQQPPLYYLLLHAWTAINGSSPYYARLLSVLIGSATLPFMYLIGRRLSSPMMGLSAALLMAASPFHIYFAQETSLFTLLTLNSVAAIYCLLRLLTDERSTQPIGSQFRAYWRAWLIPPPPAPAAENSFYQKYGAPRQTLWRKFRLNHQWLPIHEISTDLTWLGFIVFTSATLLSHNMGFLFLLAANLFMFGLMLTKKLSKSAVQPSLSSPSFWNWIKAHIGILVLCLPWAIPYLRLAGTVSTRTWLPAPTWQAVLNLFKSFLNASPVIPHNIATGIWIFFGLLLVLSAVFLRKKVAKFLFLIVLIAVPILTELIVSLWKPIFFDQTLIWTTIPLFLLEAAGIMQLRFRGLIILVLGVICTLNFFAASDYFRFYQKEDWNTAARTVVGHAEKGDLVLFNTNLGEIAFDYYFVPYIEEYSLEVERRGVPQDLITSGVSEPEMTSADVPALKAAISGYNRVWLVYSHNDFTDPQGMIPQTLAGQMTLAETQPFYGGLVQLYVK